MLQAASPGHSEGIARRLREAQPMRRGQQAYIKQIVRRTATSCAGISQDVVFIFMEQRLYDSQLAERLSVMPIRKKMDLLFLR
jgi:hypothetical protein